MKRVTQKLKSLFVNWVEALFFSKTVSEDNDSILILRLDQIGDYVLFRIFIEETYKYYKGKRKLVLCGNSIWKDLAERLDKEFIAEFIWVDVPALNKPFYLFSVYKKLQATKCGTLFHSVYSRTVEDDKLALHSGAKQIIGWNGDEANISHEKKLRNNGKYSKLLDASSECMFEFYRNKLFFEEVLNTKLSIEKPFIKTKTEKLNKKHILIFPGAGHEIRRWSPDNFATLCKFLQQELKLPLVISGTAKDSAAANKIASSIGSQAIDLTGKMNLGETMDAIENAALVITNDSGPMHISVALGIPTVCISNGNNYERFCPYPTAMNVRLTIVFPDEIDVILADKEKSKALCGKESFIEINKVKPEKVYKALKNNLFN